MTRRIGICAAVLLLVAGLARTDAASDAALDVLNQRNIRFSPEEFADLVRTDDADNVRVFLQAGMDPNTGLTAGAPVLSVAAAKGFTETAQALLEGGALINAKNADGYTPLLLAILLGRDATAMMLLDKGADVEIPNRTGKTAIMFAVEGRRPELVEALLKRKADAAATAESGVSALTIALEARQAASLKLLERAGYGPRLKALKVRFERELAAQRKEAKQEEADRRKKLKQQLKAAGGNRQGND